MTGLLKSRLFDAINCIVTLAVHGFDLRRRGRNYFGVLGRGESNQCFPKLLYFRKLIESLQNISYIYLFI